MADGGIGVKIIEAVVVLIITAGGFGLSVSIIKDQLSETEKRLKEEISKLRHESGDVVRELKVNVVDLYEKHHHCRAELPKEFAAIRTVEKLEEAHEVLDRKVSYMQGKQGGVLQ